MITETFPAATTRRARSPRHVGPLANAFGVASRVGAPRRAVALREGGFTLAELLVSVFVLGIILVMFAQLMTTATAVSRTGNKYIDTDTQARVVCDRMARDFAQMRKRADVDYYIKGPVNY